MKLSHTTTIGQLNEVAKILRDLENFKIANYPKFKTYVIIDFSIQDLEKMFLDKLPKDVAYWKIDGNNYTSQKW